MEKAAQKTEQDWTFDFLTKEAHLRYLFNYITIIYFEKVIVIYTFNYTRIHNICASIRFANPL